VSQSWVTHWPPPVEKKLAWAIPPSKERRLDLADSCHRCLLPAPVFDLFLGAVGARLLKPSPSSADNWAFWCAFVQYLHMCPDDPERGWGLFGGFGWSPGKLNPAEQFYRIGLSDKGVIPTRADEPLTARAHGSLPRTGAPDLIQHQTCSSPPTSSRVHT